MSQKWWLAMVKKSNPHPAICIEARMIAVM
jgi:hypothetical protein